MRDQADDAMHSYRTLVLLARVLYPASRRHRP